ncbi:tetratricopeptide repeat protein 6 [Rhineura floridana]|uniref:tetratricopeptide repeat protein 6 n=1 Tax=Rhineura floridana TaxID=261503 RepID=UPI002AC87DB0|nr:tetratricopeptide repeat protein 6 [Rhineura floridana]
MARERICNEGLPVSEVYECSQEDGIKVLPPKSPKSMPEWQRVAEFYVEKPQLALLGEKVKLHPGSLKMFWTPAPQKFSAPLSVMKETLFSKYESNMINGVICENFSCDLREEEESESEDDFDNLLSNVKVSGRCHSCPGILLSEREPSEIPKPLFSRRVVQHTSISVGKLPIHNKYCIKVSRAVQCYRSPSLPSKLDFEKFAEKQKKMPEDTNDYLWARKIWIKWFDERYPPSRQSPEDKPMSGKKDMEEETKDKELTDSVNPLLEEKTDEFDQCQSEIDGITQQIEEGRCPAFNYCRRGAIYRKIGKMKAAMDDLEKDAVASFQQALKLLTGSAKSLPNTFEAAEICFFMGQCYMEQVSLLEACDAFTSAVRLYPRYADAFYQRGLCRMQLQQPKCILDFNKTLAVQPKHFQAYLSRAAYYGSKERYSKAIMNCTEAIKIEPKSVRAYLYRGALKFHNRTYKHATEDLTKAIDLDNACILAYYNRGLSYHLLKDSRKALKDYGIVLLLDANKEIVLKVLINRALLYIDLAQYGNALEDFAQVALSKPKDSQLFKAIGLCCHSTLRWHILPADSRPFSNPARVLPGTSRQPSSARQPGDNTDAPLPSPNPYEVVRGRLDVEQSQSDDYMNVFQTDLDEWSGESDQEEEISYRLFDLADFSRLSRREGESLFKDPYQRRLDFVFRKIHEASAHSIRASSTASIFSWASMMWLEDILDEPNPDPAKLRKGILKIHKAAAFVADATLDASHHGARALAAEIVARRTLWLQHWDADSTARTNLSLAPYSGNMLFSEDTLKAVLVDPKDNRKPALATAKRDNRRPGRWFTPYRSFQPFRRGRPGGRGRDTRPTNFHPFKAPWSRQRSQYRGQYQSRLQKYEDAVHSFSMVLKLDPFSLDGYIGRGNAYLEYGHEEGTEQALKDFLKAIHLNPVCIKTRLCLGYSLQALGKFQKAWSQFTTAIYIDPTCHIAYDGRAVVCLQMGDTFAAFQDTNAALKITTNAELLTNRGVINQFMGYLNCAMKDYHQAITIDPNYALAYFNAANIYFLNRQFSQANDYYSKALMLDPKNESAFLNRAITNTLLKNFEEAKADFEKAICLSPFSAAIYFNKANLYSTLQQYEQAEEDISKALSIQPYDSLMYKLRADIRGKMGLIKEAIADYRKAISIQELISTG